MEAIVAVSTLNTGDEQRDGHLKSADFFDAEKFPAMTFKSTNIVKHQGDGEYAVTGDLTIHGVTKPVTFAVEGVSEPGKDPWGKPARPHGHRQDQPQGLRPDLESALETGGVLVGEDVTSLSTCSSSRR